jgi:hypothetical protein
MGQNGSTTSNAAPGVGGQGGMMSTQPNDVMATMPNYAHYEGMGTDPRHHDGLNSVGSVGSMGGMSVATNFNGVAANFTGVTHDGLAETKIDGFSGDGLAVTRIPVDDGLAVTRIPADNALAVTRIPADNALAVTRIPADNALAVTRIPADNALAVTRIPGHDGLESVGSVRAKMHAYSTDSSMVTTQDAYPGRNMATPATNYSCQPADGLHNGARADYTLFSEGIRHEDLHGVPGAGDPMHMPSQRGMHSLSHTQTSMRSEALPPGYQVITGELCTTQEPCHNYQSHAQRSCDARRGLEVTTAATNAYVPRTHPQAHSMAAPAMAPPTAPQMHCQQMGTANLMTKPSPAQHGLGHSNGAPHPAPAPPQAVPHESVSEGRQRKNWAVGSIVEVFSATVQTWHVAMIVQAARSDGPDVMTVQFYRNGEPQLKQLYRTDAYLAALGAHTAETPPGFEVLPSQSRPGQSVYYDTVSQKKYSTIELAWQLHFERLLKSTPASQQSKVAPQTGAAQMTPVTMNQQARPYGPAPVACR